MTDGRTLTDKPKVVFKLYVLVSKSRRRTYVGVAKDLRRRLRQHNGEICGGARVTRGDAWEIAAVVDNFSSDGAALSVEKNLHKKGSRWLPLHATPGYSSPLERRLHALRETIATVNPKRFAAGGPKLTVFIN